MKQAQLHIIADHDLNIADGGFCMRRLNGMKLDTEIEQYLHAYSLLTNKPKPESGRIICLLRQEPVYEIACEISHIEMYLRKHVIQFRFPVIYRSFSDFDRLRTAIYALMMKILPVCHSTEIAVYPSFWRQRQYEVKNAWHQRRLNVLQEKICFLCVSYRRTKLNLEHCLGAPLENEKALQERGYRGWICKKLEEEA
jgi:hypothetical protein